jgi:mono/diheme cytochrome c family protein
MDVLAELLRARNVATVEQALTLLPAELRTNYVLVFDSRSLQDAAPAAPRAILYGADGRFIVTFNGDVNQRGSAVLETMQFDERSNSFQFREVSFSTEGETAKISEGNPARCTACHGSPARPIWDASPTWPGVYGERYRAGLSRAEFTGMQAFLARQAQHPRYRYLIGARRFAERTTYVASSASLYDGENFEPPNQRLSVLLATLNVRSLAANLAAQPAFAPHRYALLAAAAGNCGELGSYFPASMRAALLPAMADYARYSAADGAGQAAGKRLRRASNVEAYGSGAASSDPIMLRFIAERLVGMPRQRWNLALEDGVHASAAPEGALSLEQLLFERLAGSEPELRDLRAVRSFTAADAYCAELSRRSERALTAFYGEYGLQRVLAETSAPSAGAVQPLPQLLAHCVKCHTGEVGPALPFADPEALGPLLRAGDYPHGRLLDEILYRLAPEAGAARMPRDINPTSAQRHDLEDYFVRLANP